MYLTSFIILCLYTDTWEYRKMPALLALEDGDRFLPLNLAQDSASVWSNFGVRSNFVVILTSVIACSLMSNGTDPVRPPGWILSHATISTGFCYSLWKIRILSYFSSWTRICFVICHWAKKTLYWAVNMSKSSGSLFSHLGKFRECYSNLFIFSFYSVFEIKI